MSLLSPSDLHDYQKHATNFQCARNSSALWLDMGLGKTAVALTSITYLLSIGHLRGVLVVAPLRVCRLVWRQEALKWSHTKAMRFSMVVGSPDQRMRALLRPADVYLINYENLKWLAKVLDQYFIRKKKPLPFDGVVWDEITKMKNSATQRVSAFQRVMEHVKWRTGLTGTPASNGYKDLHGQYLMLDDGARLGTNKTAFISRFYQKKGPHKEVPFDGAENDIKQLVGDITLEMSAAEYNPLPDQITNDIEIELPGPLRKLYDQLEKDFFFYLETTNERVDVFNQAALMNKCLQFSNGAVYPVAGMRLWEPIHELKLDALDEVLEGANGQPVLCSYQFLSDAERVMNRFKGLRPINLSSCKSERSLNEAMARWQGGDVRLMIGHPGSMGHGLDGLQKHGHILAWYGLTWSLDYYLQFNARLRRQGNGGAPVICHRILTLDTFDHVQSDALDNKNTRQSFLRKAVRDYGLAKGYVKK